MEPGAKPDSTNNFQARYVIRHKWTGAVAWRTRASASGAGRPTASRRRRFPRSNLAFAPRDADLAALVKSPAPEGLTLSRGEAVGPPRIPPTGGCAGCTTAPTGGD